MRKKKQKPIRGQDGLLTASPFLLPSFIGLAVFSLLPIVISFFLSLTDWNGLDRIAEAGFFAEHFLKDLRIALDEAKRMYLELPATEEAARLYEILVDEKQLGNDGTQALIKLWWN